MQQLLVALVALLAVVWYYRYAVVQLKAEAMDTVVDDDGLLHVYSLHDAEVFDVDALGRPVTVLSI